MSNLLLVFTGKYLFTFHGISSQFAKTSYFLFCRYTIVSTGGTSSALEGAGVSVTKVEELTRFPEMVRTSDQCIKVKLGLAVEQGNL